MKFTCIPEKIGYRPPCRGDNRNRYQPMNYSSSPVALTGMGRRLVFNDPTHTATLFDLRDCAVPVETTAALPSSENSHPDLPTDLPIACDDS